MDPINDLLNQCREYLEKDDVARIREACEFSKGAHQGQFRRSGEPYVWHPIAVARILTVYRMDANSIITGLLHDVLEDTTTEKELLVAKFGEDVGNLVEGVSKITHINFPSSAEAYAENFQKMMISMTKDVRILVVKLIERLHNMRTLGAVSYNKANRIARDTLAIYVPIAFRLGMQGIKTELEDLSFHYLYPYRYQVLNQAMGDINTKLQAVCADFKSQVVSLMESDGIPVQVLRQPSNLFSIYRKMKTQRRSFRSCAECCEFRIIVGSLKDCYVAMGIIHSAFKPIPGRFKDYIAIPKINGYQSLHTTVATTSGILARLRICSKEMHAFIENGVAIRWMQSYNESSNTQFQKSMRQWRTELLEIQQYSGNATEFLENVALGLFSDEVYVLDDSGQMVELPIGSTPIDFAYERDKATAGSVVAARIDGKLVSLSTTLQSGQVVELITASLAKPNPGWLDFVVTRKARAYINDYLQKHSQNEVLSPPRGKPPAKYSKYHFQDRKPLVVLADAVLTNEKMREISRDFFGAAGFKQVKEVNEKCNLFRREQDDYNAVVCIASATDFNDVSNVPQFISRQEVRQYGATCLYVIYNPLETEIETNALNAIRNTIECDIVPLQASMMINALTQQLHCEEVLRSREMPYIVSTDPYYDSNPVRDSALFFGRKDILALLPGMLARGHHIGVFGARKIGKTSLLNQLDQRLVSTPRVLIDCQGLGSKAEHIFRSIMLGLSRCSSNFGIAYRRDITPLPDEMEFIRYIDEYYEIWSKVGSGAPIVVFFDEIDKLFRERAISGSDASLTEYLRVFRTLRSLSQRNNSVACLVTACRPDINRQNILGDRLGENPMFQAFREHYLSFFSEQDSSQMIRDVGRWKDILWEPQALRQLYQYAGGHPLVSRYFASETTLRGKLKVVDATRVEKAARTTIQQIRKNEIGSYFKEGIWDSLREEEKWILQDVVVNSVEIRKYHLDEKYDDALSNLQHFGLIIEGDSKLIIQGELFRHWLQERVT